MAELDKEGFWPNEREALTELVIHLLRKSPHIFGLALVYLYKEYGAGADGTISKTLFIHLIGVFRTLIAEGYMDREDIAALILFDPQSRG